jgi:hypothetical protein
VNVLKAALPFFTDQGGIAQKFCGTKQKVVEIESFALREDFFVLRVDVGGMPGIWSESFAAQHFGRFGVVLCKANLAQDGAGLQFVVGEIQRVDGQFDGGELVVVVKDRKIRWEARCGGFGTLLVDRKSVV